MRPMSGYMSEAGMVTPYRNDQVVWTPIAAREPPAGATIVADFEDGTLHGFDVEGTAFGRRAARGFVSKLPAVGPYGGDYLLSSAVGRGRLKAKGEALSAPFVLPQAGHVEMLLGTSGKSKGLSVEIVEVGGSAQQSISLPNTRFWLESQSWNVEPEWSGKRVQLRLVDDSQAAALWLDDLWVVPQAAVSNGQLGPNE